MERKGAGHDGNTDSTEGRDFLKAAAQVFEEAWGNDNAMVTKPVPLKAMLRVCADLAAQDAQPEEGRVERWRQRLAPGSERRRGGEAFLAGQVSLGLDS